MSNNLGKMLVQNKQFSKALIVFQEILKNNPKDLRANFQMGKIFYELNDLNKSIFFLKECNQIEPNNPNVLFNLALALQSTGKIEEAKKKYLKLISINSKDIKSYYGLHSLNSDNISPGFFNNLYELYNSKKISNFEKSLINFIFSKNEMKKNNLDKELSYLELSHKQCYNSNLEFNNQSDFYYKYIISKHFNNIIFKNNFKFKNKFNDAKHIFIIGLPRSGSSLVETIISHNSSKVYSIGEFHGINTSILRQIGKIIYSKNFDNTKYNLEIDKKLFQESLIQNYNNFEKNIFLDKSLENFFNIDIILQFFPNAKFIHTFRNFNDAILGIYKTLLPELSWSHSIKNILDYSKLYKKTIKYFKDKYPNKIIDVDLQKLTNQKEIETKKILNFCEIEISKDYLNFYKNKKLFNKTNSFLQVRSTIKKYDNKKYEPYYFLLENIK